MINPATIFHAIFLTLFTILTGVFIYVVKTGDDWDKDKAVFILGLIFLLFILYIAIGLTLGIFKLPETLTEVPEEENETEWFFVPIPIPISS